MIAVPLIVILVSLDTKFITSLEQIITRPLYKGGLSYTRYYHKPSRDKWLNYIRHYITYAQLRLVSLEHAYVVVKVKSQLKCLGSNKSWQFPVINIQRNTFCQVLPLTPLSSNNISISISKGFLRFQLKLQTLSQLGQALDFH